MNMRIVDVAAAAAGVSPSTVSRVIRGGKNIAPATAELVRRVIREMGYCPPGDRNSFTQASDAPGGSSSSHGQVAVLTFSYQSWMDSICCLDNLNCLSASLAQHGLRMNYLHWPNSHCLPEEFCASLDGYILLQGQPPEGLLQQIRSKPVVSLFNLPNIPGDHVLMGYYQAGRLAANYLHQKGLRRLALLVPENLPAYANQQAEGFRIFCQEVQIQPEEFPLIPPVDQVVLGPIAVECMIVQAMEKVIESGSFPVGVFVPSCCLTALAYRYLATRGLQPGKDVHFACLGYQASAILGLCPRPAFVDMGLSEIAENTAQLLVLRIKNPQSGRSLQISVSPKLVIYDN
ncbi:MAG: LacI family DNA-binding transcriptional regulator [Anaerohalosphaeraceae bacterium]